MKRRLLVPALVLALLYCSAAQAEIIFQRSDPRGDDYGSGTLVYPSHEVYVPGLFDLRHFSVEVHEAHVSFDFRFSAISNPFRAPEGFFHQRLEVYIATGESKGNENIVLGRHEFQTAPGYGWQVRIAVAPFGESRLYLAEAGRARVFFTGIFPELLPDGKTIRVRVNRDLLPEPLQSWRYYVLVGAFDGLALDYWRDLGAGPWQVGGEGPPVFDLLAPRWGRRNQKRQLASGVLYPLGGGGGGWIVLGLLSGLAALIIGGFFVWRWIRVRT